MLTNTIDTESTNQFNTFSIDYRENELLGFFQPRQQETLFIKASKYCPVVLNLSVGDIIIGTDMCGNTSEGALVIERKTVADFEASFIDGRYRDQRSRLLTFCKEKKANLAYILEGSQGNHTRLQPGALRKLLTRLQLHYKIPVFRTSDCRDTADLIVSWLEQWKESPQSFGTRNEEISLAENIHVAKKKNACDPKIFAIACLANCHGMSSKMADTVLDKCKSWEELLRASADDISNLKLENGRRIGPVVANRLHGILHSNW